MKLNIGVCVPKIAEVEHCAKNSSVKRELLICARLKISEAEITIFRFTMEEKHFIVKVIDNSYIVLFKKFGYHYKCIAYAKFFFFFFFFFRIYTKG